MKEKAVAIIPARGGSKRIPGKNIKPFFGKPMMQYSIDAALECGLFDQVVVSTDSEEIAAVARKLGASVPALRPAELANDFTPTFPVLMNAIAELIPNGKEYTYACRITATAPLIDKKYIQQGYELISTKKVCSVLSVTTFPYPIMRAFKLNEQGELRWMWPEHELTRSNDLPEAYHDAALFTWFDVQKFLKNGRTIMPDTLPVRIPRHLVQDIDTPEDWEVAENIFRGQKRGGSVSSPAIRIGKREVSESAPCFVISEIGANHNLDINNAYKLIDLSVEAGADAVKFQSYKASTLYSRYVPRRQLEGGGQGPEIYSLIESIQMPYDWHAPLKKYCDQKGIIFLSTPFDHEAVDSLEAVGMPAYKIASSEIGDPLLLKKIARTGKPIIMSTGKADLQEVETALRWIHEEGNKQVVLLHCTVSYPAKYEAMNLRAMLTMKEKFQTLVGLSDHNLENITAVAAVAMGAKVVEKHITLSKTMPGPDHKFALEPEEFRQLVDWIRKTEVALGNGVKQLHASEEQGKKLGNRSLHVRDDLKAGHVVRLEDLIVKRPNLGIAPKELDAVVGKKLKRDVKADMWLTWEDLS